MKPFIICVLLWTLIPFGWIRANHHTMDYLTAKNYAVLDCFYSVIADKELTSGEMYEIIDQLEAWQKLIGNVENKFEHEAKMSSDQTIFSNYLQVKKLLPLLLYQQPYLLHSDTERGDIRNAVAQVSGYGAEAISIQHTITGAIVLIVGWLILSAVCIYSLFKPKKACYILLLIAYSVVQIAIVYGLYLSDWVWWW